jgi:hypothetical protein
MLIYRNARLELALPHQRSNHQSEDFLSTNTSPHTGVQRHPNAI